VEVDCSKKAAVESSKNLFLLVKVLELEITIALSWWQLRKPTDKIRSPPNLLVHLKVWHSQSKRWVRIQQDVQWETWCFSPRSGPAASVALRLTGQKTKPLKKREPGKTQLVWFSPADSTCRTEPMVMQLMWRRRRVGVLLCSLRLRWILWDVKPCP